MIRVIIWLLLSLSIWAPGLLFAQDALADFEFFLDDAEDADLKMKLQSDWKGLRRSKEDKAQQPARMTLHLTETDSVRLPLKVRARGVFRKQHCSWAPIRLNFRSGDFSGSTVASYDKLKLVTHCRDQSEYTQHMLLEYYTYRAYELLTAFSFRTRLLQLDYIDSAQAKSSGWQYGFLIEDMAQVAARNGGAELKDVKILPYQLDPELSTQMAIFQFVIGHTDWSTTYQHNVRVVRLPDSLRIASVPVPYDFDFCGLINAPYAVPPVGMGIERVTERKFRGLCRTDEQFATAIDRMLERRNDIMNLFRNSPLLDARHKKSSLSFLSYSFDILSDPKLVKAYIHDECRK